MTTLANTSDSVPPPRPIRFVNNQGQPPSKRRRINAACLTCRRRKTRCAGERPLCSTCTKNGHRCLGYPEDIKKEGGERPALTDADEHDGQDEWNDEDDKKQRKALAATTKRPPGNAPGSQEAPEVMPTKSDVDTRINDGDLSIPAPLASQPPPAPRALSAHELPGSPATVRRTESHRIPYFRYFGPTAIVPGYKQMVVSVRDRRRSTGGSGAPTSPLSTHSGAIASSSVAGSDVVPEDLAVYDPNDPAPVHPLIISLVKTFFLQMGSNYPFLKQAKFLRLVKEKRVEAILVDAVCSLAARFSDAPALTNGNDKMPRTERGAVFAQRAKQATVDTFPCPSVGAVQACLLMAYEGFGANQDSALWMYLGLAIRMAVDLGIQKEVGVQYQGEKDPWYTRNRGCAAGEAESPEEARDEAEPLSPQEQHEVVQERIDTFWAVFILDRVISSGTGRPVTFRDDDFELAFPEPKIDPATNWPDPFPIFLSIIHLYGRVCDVLNKIRDVRDLTRDKWDKLGDMEHQLTRLYKNWDSRLQFNVSNFKVYLGIGQGTTFILLHFWFHALFIILHQPTLLTPFGELRSELQLLADSRELSMSSAKTICDILSFADLIDPKSFIGNPFTSQPIYIAACAFLMESSANASEAPSRTGSPGPKPTDVLKPSVEKSRETKSSRHSLLASAANQNYQRCYNSLQQIHFYWGGVKYILTALDQKSKGIWDCETYTSEEYESTKTARRESRGTMSSRFPRFDNPSSPKVTGPPIAWSLAGTANSPNSSLTLMYQNPNSGVPGSAPVAQAMPRQPSTPPGNMVYDPIRQSLPESGVIFPPAYPQPNTSAIRHSPRPPIRRKPSNLSAGGSSNRPTVKFDPVLEDSESAKMFLPPAYTPSSQQSNGYPTYSASPSSSMVDNGVANTAEALVGSSANAANNMFYPQSVPFQPPWGNIMGNMDAITFDSQDIDISSLGLQQPELMGHWLEHFPQDVLGLFENQDMGQGGQQG